MSTVDEYYKKNKEKTAGTTQAKVDAINNAAAASGQAVKNEYGAQITDLEQSATDAIRENNVQKYINERVIAENMANAGLNRSGLNLTQITANQLSHANTEAKIKLQRDAGVAALNRAMSAKLSEIEVNRSSQETSIRTADDESNYALAVSMYNADQEAEAARTKAVNDAIVAAQKQKQDDYNTLISQMANKNLSEEIKSQLIADYEAKYPEEAGKFSSVTSYTAYGNDNDSAPLDDKTIQNILSHYHQNNEDQHIIFDMIEQAGVDPNSKYGMELKHQILRMTEGTRLFWTNPHVDGPLSYTPVKESDKVTKVEWKSAARTSARIPADPNQQINGISYGSTIQDQYGNTWTLQQVYEASCRALAKEKYPTEWKKHVGDYSILKEAQRQTLKVQKQVFGN